MSCLSVAEVSHGAPRPGSAPLLLSIECKVGCRKTSWLLRMTTVVAGPQARWLDYRYRVWSCRTWLPHLGEANLRDHSAIIFLACGQNPPSAVPLAMGALPPDKCFDAAQLGAFPLDALRQGAPRRKAC